MAEFDPYADVQYVTSSLQDWARAHKVHPHTLQTLSANGIGCLDDVMKLDSDVIDIIGAALDPDELGIFKAALRQTKEAGTSASSSNYVYLQPGVASSSHQRALPGQSFADRPLPGQPQYIQQQWTAYHQAQRLAQEEDGDDIYEDIPSLDGPDLQEIIHDSQQLPPSPGKKLVQYKVKVTETARCGEVKVRRCEFGSPSESSTVEEKYILLLGETGAGKSTLIDAMLNHILGVSHDVNFRLRLIDPMGEDPTWRRLSTDSQTDWITCYTIHQHRGSPLDFTLHIVDTPGFGDTRGVDHDKAIVEQIRELFSSTEAHGITWLDALCIVLKSSTNRLAAKERYVLDNVLALFGNDVKDSIFGMITFSDQTNLAQDALKSAKVPVKKSYEFNNNWFDANDTVMSKMFFNLTHDNLAAFFEMLKTTDSVSLRLAAEVLEERKVLEKHAEGLIDLIRKVSGEINVLQETQNVIDRGHRAGNKVKVIEMKTIKVPTKEKNRSCTTCLVTCQKKCDTLQRLKYGMARAKNICDVCKHPNKDHVVHKWKYETEQVDTVKTVEEIKTEHNQTVMATDDELKAHLKRKEQEGLQNMRQHLQTMRTCMKRLDEIALRPRVGSMKDYVAIVLDREKQEKRPGYERRIEMLRKMSEVEDAVGHMDNNPEDIIKRFSKFDVTGFTSSESTI